MSDEERAAHAQWHAAHQPGSLGARARRREDRRHARDLAAFIAEERPAPSNPEAEALGKMIGELKRQKEAAELAFQLTQGVFS
jgi:hypothetical protein